MMNKAMKLQRMIASASVLIIIATCSGLGISAGNAARRPINPNAGQSSAPAAGELRYKAPEGWLIEHPASKMRVAQYKLPKAAGDSEDASLVLYYFGPSQGGSVQDNIDRWLGQIEQPDGSSSREKAKTETLTVNGLKVTMIDVAGNYTAEMSPGSGTHYNKPDYRLRAAVVETSNGNYFVKLVGPQKTVRRWDQAFIDYVKSFEFKSSEKRMDTL